MYVLYGAERKLGIAEYQFDTALAADLANPVAHELALAQARYVLEMGFNLRAVVSVALVTETADRICSKSSAPSGTDVNGTLTAGGVPPCPSGLQGIDVGLSLGFVSFSVNCEEVGVDVSSLSWIGGFGNLSHNFRTGSTTIYVGPQVGVNVSVGPFGGGASARVGGYITIDASGTISDIGMRGQVSAGGSVGAATAYTGGSLDFSYAGSA